MSSSPTDYILVHFVCGKYPEDMGGVARFDNLIERIFPSRIFFKAPEESDKMIRFLIENSHQKIMVITDNQFAIYVPELFPCIIYHHGVARIHAQRDPQWEKDIAKFCIEGQDEIFSKRNPHNTVFVGVSSYCLDYFEELYQKDYTRFLRYNLPHPIEPVKAILDNSENNINNKINSRPIILGDWRTVNKGILIVQKLARLLPDFTFLQLRTKSNNNLQEHQEEVSKFYQEADIYLSLSKSEGNSFSLVDAFNHNLLVIGTNVGFLYQLEKENNQNKNNNQNKKNNQNQENTKYAEIFPWEWTNQDNLDKIADLIRKTWNNRKKYSSSLELSKKNNLNLKSYSRQLQNICLNLFIKSLSSPLIYPCDNTIFWQYPVVTEQFYATKMINYHNLKKKTTHLGNYIYLGIPWATIIDKNQVNQKWLKVIKNIISLRKLFLDDCQVVSFCQHIDYQKLANIYQQLGVDILMIAHKESSKNQLEFGQAENSNSNKPIALVGLPLYPIASIRTGNQLLFSLEQVLEYPKKYLFSFQGAYMNHYLHPIRKELFKWESHPENGKKFWIKNIGQWHFEKEVYQEQISGKSLTEKEEEEAKERVIKYRRLLLDSSFTLCPIGAGVNTIRFWETLGMGTIPVIIADQFNPEEYLLEDDINQDFYLKIPYDDIRLQEPKKLIQYLENIPEAMKEIMVRNGYQILEKIMKKYPYSKL